MAKRKIKPSPVQVVPPQSTIDDYITLVGRVQSGYHRVNGRLIRVTVETDPIGGQYTVRELSLEEAERLISEDLSGLTWYGSYYSGSGYSVTATKLKDFTQKTPYEYHKHHGHLFRLSGKKAIFVQVWAQNESPEHAWKAMPPAPWYQYKTIQQRKWERRNRCSALRTYKSQMYKHPRGEVFKDVVVGSFRTRPLIPYLYGFSIY